MFSVLNTSVQAKPSDQAKPDSKQNRAPSKTGLQAEEDLRSFCQHASQTDPFANLRTLILCEDHPANAGGLDAG